MRRTLLVGVIGAALAGLAYVVPALLAPHDVTVRSAASICRRDYALARTAADTASVDDRIWQINRNTWRRLPSCGELRRTGQIARRT